MRTQLIEDRLAVEQKSENRTSSSSDIRNKLYDFYFNIIPPFSTNLKKILNRSSENLYTTVYQLIGNNLRSSGSAFDNQYKKIHIYRIAVRVNKVIKIIRRLRGKSKKTLIAIDAFRNPFEISFFRERYAAFYLFAIMG